MNKKLTYSTTFSMFLMLFQGVAYAQGFYGGFNVRPKNVDPGFALIEPQSLSWLKPTGDEPSQQAMVYGGYKLHRDVGVEAALTHSQRLGLRFDPKSFGFTAGDQVGKTWNLTSTPAGRCNPGSPSTVASVTNSRRSPRSCPPARPRSTASVAGRWWV